MKKYKENIPEDNSGLSFFLHRFFSKFPQLKLFFAEKCNRNLELASIAI